MPDDPIWTYPAQANAAGDGHPGAHSSDPGDTVGWLWEEPADIAQGHVILRLILGNPNASTDPWAGASVYFSYDDVTYALMARTSQRSIIGHNDNALAAGAADWQPAGTVDVDITASPGTLVTTDAAGCQAGVNLCVLGDEIMSFVDATPIALGYRLTGLQRAWYGTARVLHNIGDRFAMLSPLQLRVELPISAKGQTWHWKAPSLNIGRVEQDMGGIAPTHLTFDGKGLGATLLNAGLHLLDTNASHDLILAPGSDLTADRILTITTGDAARLLSLLADLYIEAESRVNQDLTTDAAGVLFAGVTVLSNQTVADGTAPLIVRQSANFRFSAIIIDNPNAGTGAYSELQFANDLGARKAVLQFLGSNYPTVGSRLMLHNLVSGATLVLQTTGAGDIRLTPGAGGVVNVTAGSLNLSSGVPFIGEYQTQSGAWATPAGGVNGQIVTVYNSTAAASRLYVYSNAGWHYTALT